MVLLFVNTFFVCDHAFSGWLCVWPGPWPGSLTSSFVVRGSWFTQSPDFIYGSVTGGGSWDWKWDTGTRFSGKTFLSLFFLVTFKNFFKFPCPIGFRREKKKGRLEVRGVDLTQDTARDTARDTATETGHLIKERDTVPIHPIPISPTRVTFLEEIWVLPEELEGLCEPVVCLELVFADRFAQHIGP
jgi:hypothetical protein